jgi:hypothetical protein
MSIVTSESDKKLIKWFKDQFEQMLLTVGTHLSLNARGGIEEAIEDLSDTFGLNLHEYCGNCDDCDERMSEPRYNEGYF